MAGLLELSFTETVLTVSTLLLVIFWFLRKKRDPRCPPGPRPLPLIGNLHQLGSKPQHAMMELAEKYGPCFSLKLGSENAIVLNHHQLVKKVFADTKASGRTSNPIFLSFAGGNYGLLFAEGERWEQQRRFTLKSLRDVGLAKSAMEGMLLEEVNSMLKYFGKRLSEPTTGYRIFNGPVFNTLWNLISSERNDWDAPKKPQILQDGDRLMAAINLMNRTGLLFLPILRFIAPNYTGWTAWLDSVKAVNRLCTEATEKHKANLNIESPQDFIDLYLVEMANAKDPASSFYKEQGEKNLKALIPDLFLGGSETTAHSLSWTLLFLAYHSEIQKKLQNEIDDVVGPGRQPSISDRPNLPYTEAIVMEVLRRSAVVNLGVPHRMVEDAVIDGYFFPKDTTIYSNLWYIHNNPKVWGDPQNFRPERFLSPDGKKIVRHEAFIPFSAGKRQCPGKALAEDSLFLFTACIFQKYTITPDPASSGKELQRVEPTAKMVNEPDIFNIVVNNRVD